MACADIKLLTAIINGTEYDLLLDFYHELTTGGTSGTGTAHPSGTS
jgi:hypothetical protein